MGLDISFIKTAQDASEEDKGTEVAYFRKVNFLVRFFNYQDDCSFMEVSEKKLRKLVDYCDKVLNDHSLAEEYLPTQGGFFFGSTDYDESYFYSVGCVREKMLEILKNTDWDKEDIYFYCWW